MRKHVILFISSLIILYLLIPNVILCASFVSKENNKNKQETNKEIKQETSKEIKQETNKINKETNKINKETNKETKQETSNEKNNKTKQEIKSKTTSKDNKTDDKVDNDETDDKDDDKEEKFFQEYDEDNAEYDEIILDGNDFINDAFLEKALYTKTPNIRIKCKDDVIITQEEISNIIYFCIFNNLEMLDLSEVNVENDEISLIIYLPSKTMRYVRLPKNLKKLGDYTFLNWTSLKRVSFNSKLKEIGEGAFKGCMCLDEANFGSELERIGEQAFIGDISLKTVTLPDSLNFLGKFSFAECLNIKTFFFPNNDKIEIDGKIFSDKTIILVVKYESDAYLKLVDFTEDSKYKFNNKIVVISNSDITSLKKEPLIHQRISNINKGEKINLDDILKIDIKGTNAISYEIRKMFDGEICQLNAGEHILKYKVLYFLNDIDISSLKDKVKKIVDYEEVFDYEEKYFLRSNVIEVDKSVSITVENYASELTSETSRLTCKYSKYQNALMHSSFMTGYKDGTFKPQGNITKAEVAAILSRVMRYDSNKKYDCTFEDVPNYLWARNYIGYINREGVLDEGLKKFNPTEFIKKGTFIEYACKALKIPPSKNESIFPDAWNTKEEPYIAALEEMNIITGSKNSTLGVNKLITRAEICKILVDLLDRKTDISKKDSQVMKDTKFTDVKKDSWYYDYIIEATSNHYVTELH